MIAYDFFFGVKSDVDGNIEEHHYFWREDLSFVSIQCILESEGQQAGQTKTGRPYGILGLQLQRQQQQQQQEEATNHTITNASSQTNLTIRTNLTKKKTSPLQNASIFASLKNIPSTKWCFY